MTHIRARFIAAAALLILSGTAAYSQMFDKTERQSGAKSPDVQSLLQLQPAERPSVLDGPVDPAEYRVGPGDGFTVSVWSSMPVTLNVTVNPEGTVIIPSMGEYQVAGRTLDEVKKLVIAEMHKKYTQQVSFTLSSPRSFRVTVKGNVLKEGKYIVQATDRADAAIALANSLLNAEGGEQAVTRLQSINQEASQRRVEIVHRDGTKSLVDFEQYFATRNSAYNGYLRDGDLIIVPKKDLVKNFISIFGAVNKPGVYEFCEGDRLQTAIDIARGTTPLVDSARITIVRFNSDGTKVGEYLRSLSDGANGTGMLLQRGDQIVIGEKLELTRDNRVFVDGEVNFPGFYPIRKDSTLLSTVIRRANGFTPSASLKNSRLYRKTVNEKDIMDERLESARGGYTPEDSSYYFLETNIRINREQVPVDFEGLFLHDHAADDVYLKNGDVISIGSKVRTIYIFGQVVKPGHYEYTPGKDIATYVDEAGGFTSEARKGDLRIIKANTRQWLEPDKTTVEEGDYIWVPKDPYRTGGYYLAQMSQVFGILGTVATLALLVVQLTK